MNINIRLGLSFLLLGAGLLGFYMLSGQPTVIRILSFLAGAVAFVVVFLTTPQGQRAIGFLGEAITEAKKVVWPTRKETIQMTLIVFVLVVIMAIFLAFIDISFSYIINLLLGRGD
ncbi:preprotein translocase subunit SecE [Methylophilaceae bacterium]|nr:preprotein translocase subunit SecE [Methylophilaceae bacterium]